MCQSVIKGTLALAKRYRTLNDMGKLPKSIHRQVFRDVALRMALHCVRNTIIEDYHTAGKLSDAEMCAFNHEVADKLYSFLLIMLDPRYTKAWDQALVWLYPPQWDEPKCDESFLFLVRRLRADVRPPFSNFYYGQQTAQGGEGPPPSQ